MRSGDINLMLVKRGYEIEIVNSALKCISLTFFQRRGERASLILDGRTWTEEAVITYLFSSVTLALQNSMGRDEATIAPMIEYLLFARICILSDILDAILSLCILYCQADQWIQPDSARLAEKLIKIYSKAGSLRHLGRRTVIMVCKSTAEPTRAN